MLYVWARKRHIFFKSTLYLSILTMIDNVGMRILASKSNKTSDSCSSRGLEHLQDLTEIPWEDAIESDYYYNYTYFFNRDYGDLDPSLNLSHPSFKVFPNQDEYWKLSTFVSNSANSSYNAEFLNNNRLIQEDYMMSKLPLRICYEPNFQFQIQNHHTYLVRDGHLREDSNCNLWHIFRSVFKKSDLKLI